MCDNKYREEYNLINLKKERKINKIYFNNIIVTNYSYSYYIVYYYFNLLKQFVVPIK